MKRPKDEHSLLIYRLKYNSDALYLNSGIFCVTMVGEDGTSGSLQVGNDKQPGCMLIPGFDEQSFLRLSRRNVVHILNYTKNLSSSLNLVSILRLWTATI